MEVTTFRLLVTGLVQGIGFRPFIFRLATKHGLSGQVENRNDGVVIEVNSTVEEVRLFRAAIIREAPVASSIEHVEISEIAGRLFSSFEIHQSEDISDGVTEISPDIAVCPECLEDLERQQHRISYPLINCTHCGPRFSIIRDLPYDRPNTTMAPFGMCAECEAEYNSILDRRFHAQPVACNRCGPAYSLVTRQGVSGNTQEIPGNVAELISEGALMAIKGTGGFHLVCDAFSEEGVSKLRKMKKRDGKPFALMFRNADEARPFVEINPVEEELLSSWQRPIVLLRKKKEITNGIANGLSTLGIMLPYMPFHHLLFKSLQTPALVMTSGNFSEEPILISDEAVSKQFSDHVDGVLTYNREIFNRVDDSLTAVFGSSPMVLRRARGYTPAPIRSGVGLEGIIGTGAELTGSFCLGKGTNAIMSQYTGDLKNLETFDFYRQTYHRYCRLFRFSPELVVSDLHPDYLSTRFARQLAEETGAEHISVQHHHAHIASGMFSAGLEGEVIGFSFDGTGLGTDGHSWGAEVLRAGFPDFERLFHFEYMPLPGGDRAISDPWRMAVSYLYKSYGAELLNLKIPLTADHEKRKIRDIITLIEKEINTPFVSSAGRLFDAVAAITGLNYRSSYQAQSPMLLESAIDTSARGMYTFELRGQQVSFSPMIHQIVDDLHKGISTGVIAAKFHHGLVELILQLALEVRERTGLDRVVLAGGTFQNRFLTEKIRHKLDIEQFAVYLPEMIPVNDQGIAVGQLAIGAHRRNS
ncbi:MAG: carbamoyltransferase HypF [Bacteroidetes bacterium]|nr:carbamoyltransferase HypF [Bacteroidota bacterium]